MSRSVVWGMWVALFGVLALVIWLIVWWFSTVGGLGDALAPGADDGQMNYHQGIQVNAYRGELEHLAQDGLMTAAEVTEVVGDGWSGVTGRSLDIRVEVPGAPADDQCFRFRTDDVGGRVGVVAEPVGARCTTP